MTINTDIPVSQIIDDLLNELAAQSSDPQTKPGDFFEKITVTIESLFSPKYFAVIAAGANQESIFVHGSKSLVQSLQIPEMKRNSEFAKTIESKTCPAVVVQRTSNDQRIYVRVGSDSEVWGGMVTVFDKDANVEPLTPIFDAIGEITSQFVANRAQQRNAEFLQQFLRFSFNSHSSLNPRLVANNVANDARLILGCERLSILEASKRRSKLLAISSVSSIENRSALLKKMAKLVNLASRRSEPFFSDQPPTSQNIQDALDSFRKVSGFGFVVGVPLVDQTRKKSRSSRLIGYLLAESNEDINRFEFSRGLKLTAPHISLALGNSHTVSRIPFGRTLAAVGKLRSASNLFSLVLGLGLVFLAFACLFLVETEFKIRINGELRPEIENNVFAPADGFVEKVLVSHGTFVSTGQTLMELSSPALELERKQLKGEQLLSEKTLETKKIALNQAASGTTRDPSIAGKLAADISELEFELANLEDKEKFLEERISDLVILSPIDGVVTNWQLKNNILKKPVRWGEELANIAFESGAWKINFKVPEHQIGYLLAAQKESDEPVEVEFFFESNPTQKIKTRILKISPSTEFDAEFGPVVSVVCNVPDDAVANFSKRHGARVIADVICGKKPVFESWTQEFFDSLRRRLVW